MTTTPVTTQSSQKNRRWLIILLAVLLACVCLVVVISGVMLAAWTYIDTQNVSSSMPNEWVEDTVSVHLTVAPDGCRVERGEVTEPEGVRMLTWVIADADGEMVYGYYQRGQYRVHMKGWYEGRYHVLSDEVVVNCQ